MMELRKINDTLYVNVGGGNITSVTGGLTSRWVRINFVGGSHVELRGTSLSTVVVALRRGRG